MGWKPIATNLPYGDRHRKHRRLIEDCPSTHALASYRPQQEFEASVLMKRISKEWQVYYTEVPVLVDFSEAGLTCELAATDTVRYWLCFGHAFFADLYRLDIRSALHVHACHGSSSRGISESTR
jgi:hypothetical protein